MILNARLETLQQDEVFNKTQRTPFPPLGHASLKDLDFWCLKIKVPHIFSHGKSWLVYPFQYIESKLSLEAVGKLLAFTKICWHTGNVIHH